MDEKTIKVGNHYQIPVPLRNLAMMFPRMIEKKTQYLKRLFEKDPNYCRHYTNFMDEIIIKGYAK